MKYSVGDLLLVKHCEYKYRSCLRTRPPHPWQRSHRRLCDYLRHELYNSYGIVTEAIKHSDVWEDESTNSDNTYVWFSQIDGKEYYFYEDEITGEII